MERQEHAAVRPHAPVGLWSCLAVRLTRGCSGQTVSPVRSVSLELELHDERRIDVGAAGIEANDINIAVVAFGTVPEDGTGSATVVNR